MCHRPCVYILKGSQCQQGALCQFCHHGQHSPIPKLDQNQRARVQRLTDGELLGLLIPHIREQAKAAGVLEQAEDFIRTLEGKMPCTENSEINNMPRKELCKLKKMLNARCKLFFLLLTLVHFRA